MITHHLHPDRVPEIRLVGAIPQERVPVGDQRPVGVNLLARREFLEHPLHNRLNGGKNIGLLDKAHLDIQLIKIGGRAVGTRVFVAETGRDLKITVEPRHHDQLLELLGGLRQGVELARMQARRHQKIARAFGGRCGDDRRLEFGEARVPHAVAHRPHHVRAQHHVAVQPLAAQVEKTVGQAGFLGVVLIAEDRQRQIVGGAEDLDRRHIDLDRAGGDFRVHQRRIPRLDPAVDADHGFGLQLFDRRKGRAVAVGQKLGHAVMVAQIDKQDAAVIADPVHPTRQAHGFAGVGFVQRRTGMAAVSVHSCPLGHRPANSSRRYNA